ncbi:MAG: ABC transporter ATP-binding protein [Deltaproteobacteria bacterium]|nr:ABC transporter ATP-binding protein [Deltaproteobacteria bacterium]
MSLLVAEGVSHRFAARVGLGRSAELWAAREVDLTIAKGECVALVGESGCGKSTLARLFLRLLAPTRGRISFDGVDLTALRGRALAPFRRRMQMIWQDPLAALNPRQRVLAALREPLRVHRFTGGREVHARVATLLAHVGLDGEVLPCYPHELSGGQRQRVVIASALAVRPELIVADEPTASLDVSAQAQIINLMAELKRALGLAYLFITHDLSLVPHLADRVAVMYVGRIVEMGPARDVLAAPQHPYTRALLSASPSARGAAPLAGEPASPLAPPAGCPFHPRCALAEARCKSELPVLREVAGGRQAACHLAGVKA